jgi:hypothetical protein
LLLVQINFHRSASDEKSQIEVGAFFKEDGVFLPSDNGNVRAELLQKFVVIIPKDLELPQLLGRKHFGNAQDSGIDAVGGPAVFV